MRIECRYFDECSAPICPLHPEKKLHSWYPDEEICRRNAFTKEIYIKIQKKIKKKARSIDTLFTFDMLNTNCVIGKAIKGINPKGDIDSQIKIWLKNHPVKTPKLFNWPNNPTKPHSSDS